jgi:flavin reductase
MAGKDQLSAINDVRLHEAFRDAMRRFATTVSIISCSDGEGRLHGMSATAVTSVCVDPPALLVCVNNSSATHGALNRSGRFCVNMLRSFHSELSQVFSGKTRGDERFRSGDWRSAADGLPYLADAQANLFCRVDRTLDYETHTIFLGRVYATRVEEHVDALLYQDGRYSIARPVPDGGPNSAVNVGT